MKIKLLSENAIMPTKATEGAAAYDLAIPHDVIILPGRQIIPLDFALEIPKGYEAKIEPRSGFSAKGFQDIKGERRDVDVLVGKIDSDYRGNIGVIVHSKEILTFKMAKGTRCAQMTFYKVEDMAFEVVDELSATERGEGGFGHTGTK